MKGSVARSRLLPTILFLLLSTEYINTSSSTVLRVEEKKEENRRKEDDGVSRKYFWLRFANRLDGRKPFGYSPRVSRIASFSGMKTGTLGLENERHMYLNVTVIKCGEDVLLSLRSLRCLFDFPRCVPRVRPSFNYLLISTVS